SPTAFNSTSGVLPTSSSRLCATTLRIAPPDVDRRAELSEELVDPPYVGCRVGVDVRVAVTITQLGFQAVQSRQAQQVVAGVPRPVLNHSFPPFAAELRLGDEVQPSGTCVPFEGIRLCALGHDRECVEQRCCFLWLERGSRAGD